MTKNILDEAKEQFDDLMSSFQSIEIATIDEHNIPEVSYSPSLTDESNSFYVYVSELSKHTKNFLDKKIASIMIIEDESVAKTIFARKRLTFRCDSHEIPRDTSKWDEIMIKFEEKFGSTMKQLKTMTDFHLIELKPDNGRLVYGFGKAFDIVGEKMDEITHVKGFNNRGHKFDDKKDKKKEPLNKESISRIVDHMNDDHVDAIMSYISHYGKVENADNAKIESLDPKGMDIEYELNKENKKIRINFDHELDSAHDAHMTMVKMAKESK